MIVNRLMLPMRASALQVTSTTKIEHPSADFSKLPWTNEKQDFNGESPYLSQNLLNKLFSDPSSNKLDVGVHLHWEIPSSLAGKSDNTVVHKSLLHNFVQSYLSGMGVSFDDFWKHLADYAYINHVNTQKAFVNPPDQRRNDSPYIQGEVAAAVESYLQQSSFIAVPNRWMITRSGGGLAPGYWLVESDCLREEKSSDAAISVPVRIPASGVGKPFRYMGRTTPISNGSSSGNAGTFTPPDSWEKHYHTPLSAVAYGDPNFAAFYPNCQGIFGFYDSEVPSTYSGEITYEIFGWYDSENWDYYNSILLKESNTPFIIAKGDLIDRFGSSRGGLYWAALGKLSSSSSGNSHQLDFREITYSEIENANFKPDLYAYLATVFWDNCIRPHLNWELEIMPDQVLPDYLCCFSRVILHADALPENPNYTTSGLDFSIGNSGTEAISAYLAEQVADPVMDKSEVEEILEAIQLEGSMTGKQIDLGFQLEELRHEKGFTGEDKDFLWAIVPRDQSAADSSVEKPTSRVNSLPQNLAILLVELNKLQEEYNEAQANIISLRAGLFADWARYQQIVYFQLTPPSDAPPVNDTIKYIDEVAIDQLEKLIHDTGQLVTDFPNLDRTDPHDIGTLLYKKGSGVPTVVKNPSSLASKVADQIKKVRLAIAAYNRSIEHSSSSSSGGDGFLPKALTPLKLAPTPTERYWRSHDPFLLASGPAVAQPPRYGQTPGTTEDIVCVPKEWQFSHWQSWELINHVSELQQFIDSYSATDFQDSESFGSSSSSGTGAFDRFAINHQKTQPWIPILMDWEVDIRSLKAGLGPQGDYTPEYLTDNFKIEPDAPTLSLISDAQLATTPATYEGRAVLTPHAHQLQSQTLAVFLFKRLSSIDLQVDGQTIDQLLGNANAAGPASLSQAFCKYAEAILHAYEIYISAKIGSSSSSSSSTSNEIIASLKAFLVLCNQTTAGQRLTGFHNALLMQKQAMQLPVQDPINFAPMQKFASRVSFYVTTENKANPLMTGVFSPIRAGGMFLKRTRIIDTFGRYLDIGSQTTDLPVITSEPLTVPWSSPVKKGNIFLPARMIQACLPTISWLEGAGHDSSETEILNSVSPICGWILPNFLDGSIVFYDRNGYSLGSITIDHQDPWQPAPGSTKAVPTIQDIANEHLRNVALALVKDVQGGHLLPLLAESLQNIHPETSLDAQDLAILMGRPIAVTRVEISVAMKGSPAYDLSWAQFSKEVNSNPPQKQTMGVSAVNIPFRLGEFRQLNDSLVGYWREDANGVPVSPLYLPQSDPGPSSSSGGSGIAPKGSGYDAESVAIEGPKRTFTLLMEPKGSIHLTTGLLPVTSVELSPEQYQDALSNIYVTFLTTPLVASEENIYLTLPREPGFEWSWLEENDEGVYQEIWTFATITKQSFAAAFDLLKKEINSPAQGFDVTEVWKALFKANWLGSIKGLPDGIDGSSGSAHYHAIIEGSSSGSPVAPSYVGIAEVLSPNERQSLQSQYKDLEGDLKKLLAQASNQIIPAPTNEFYFGTPVLREGYLKIKPETINVLQQ